MNSPGPNASTNASKAAMQKLPGTPEPTHVWRGAGGVAIAGDRWGDPEGPLVLLQHGGGQTRHAWKGAGETLGAAGYDAVALDARGHGDSGWSPAGEYSVDHMVEDLRHVVDALGGRAPVMVGASMGGGTSLIAIGEAQLPATALVLVDIAPRIESAGAQKVMEFMRQKPEGFDTLEEVALAIASYQPHRSRPRNLDGLAKNVRQGENGKYFWHWDPARLQQWNEEDRAHYRERLIRAGDNLPLPTLLVHGGLSDVLSDDGARDFLRQCPQAEYVKLGDAAHMVAGDRNDIFGAAVVDFLARAVPLSSVSRTAAPAADPPQTA